MLYLLVPVMTLGGAIGAFFFKQGSQKLTSPAGIFLQPQIYIGGAFYVLSALLNVYLLQFLDYSVLYPMTAMTYVWSTIIAKYFLGEQITYSRLLGITAICIGVIFCI